MAFTSYCALLTETRDWMARGKPVDWMLTTIQNSRDMKITRSNIRDVQGLIDYLEGKCSDEKAVACGLISTNGGVLSEIMGGGG